MKYRLMLLPLALAACSQTPPDRGGEAPAAPASAPVAASTAPAPAAVDAGLLPRYHWRLTQATDSDGKRIDALFVRADKPLQLDFVRDRMSVSNACNRLGGNFSVQGDRLKLGQMAQTMMACADPALTALDGAISQRLQSQPTIRIADEGNAPTLTLIAGNGDTLVFAGEPTAETRYGGEGETVFLEVAPETQPCSHPLIPDKPCLQVRERKYGANGVVESTGEWQPLYQDIEGYTHEPGVRNVLRVKRFAVKNPPADAPSSAYVLDMVVESEIARKK
jgi:heat shock protein HslJ